MDLRVLDDERAVARAGAELVAGWIGETPHATVVPAMGATPQALYGELAQLAVTGRLDVGGITAIQLDEYADVGADDRRSLFGWLRRSFAAPLGISGDRLVRLGGDGVDPAAACAAYDEAVRAAGGVDVAILGLGPNGHLGFNEPPSPADAPTREVALTAESLASNAAYWEGGAAAVPRRALTMGMPWLLEARHVLLVVTGARKRAVLERMLDGPIGPDLPASYLRTHPGAILLADRAASPESG